MSWSGKLNNVEMKGEGTRRRTDGRAGQERNQMGSKGKKKRKDIPQATTLQSGDENFDIFIVPESPDSFGTMLKS